jgi:hypothetical protein
MTRCTPQLYHYIRVVYAIHVHNRTMLSDEISKSYRAFTFRILLFGELVFEFNDTLPLRLPPRGAYNMHNYLVLLYIFVFTSPHAAAHPTGGGSRLFKNSIVSTEAKTYDFLYTRKWLAIEWFFNIDYRFIVIIIIFMVVMRIRGRPYKIYTTPCGNNHPSPRIICTRKAQQMIR